MEKIIKNLLKIVLLLLIQNLFMIKEDVNYLIQRMILNININIYAHIMLQKTLKEIQQKKDSIK